MEITKITKAEIKNLKQLILDIGNLDCNSSYLYLVLSHYFSDNCFVAKIDGKIVGFITSLLVEKNILFVWQIGVDKNFQKRGIAVKLLQELVANHQNKISKIEFTISPSNNASFLLFEKYAKKIGSQVEKVGEFGRDLFFEKNHEEEVVYQIKL